VGSFHDCCARVGFGTKSDWILNKTSAPTILICLEKISDSTNSNQTVSSDAAIAELYY
jgi:hypothetical protein